MLASTVFLVPFLSLVVESFTLPSFLPSSPNNMPSVKEQLELAGCICLPLHSLLHKEARTRSPIFVSFDSVPISDFCADSSESGGRGRKNGAVRMIVSLFSSLSLSERTSLYLAGGKKNGKRGNGWNQKRREMDEKRKGLEAKKLEEERLRNKRREDEERRGKEEEEMRKKRREDMRNNREEMVCSRRTLKVRGRRKSAKELEVVGCWTSSTGATDIGVGEGRKKSEKESREAEAAKRRQSNSPLPHISLPVSATADEARPRFSSLSSTTPQFVVTPSVPSHFPKTNHNGARGKDEIAVLSLQSNQHKPTPRRAQTDRTLTLPTSPLVTSSPQSPPFSSNTHASASSPSLTPSVGDVSSLHAQLSKLHAGESEEIRPDIESVSKGVMEVTKRVVLELKRVKARLSTARE
ncbi:hypothetical protein BLNAU_16366 [Blattamonas nauphoetae]|uniref:Uncharacterized protein n=1 Tax=Blattamonas nauphoetae TaxID=2049346 RepID=A0ABQ9X8D4_9EUKA|nr:hypothetical protein BLNAU_16366 [Blattamonas nauphoetae]